MACIIQGTTHQMNILFDFEENKERIFSHITQETTHHNDLPSGSLKDSKKGKVCLLKNIKAPKL